MHKNMIEPKFEAAVGMSRKWDAREAGREVAETAIQKLNRPPDFFLLFSTIHYEKHGGFQEFLNGVWDVLPEGTPLAGGTVAGFMNNYGCYARGATALAVSYPNMDVAVGIGNHTKRNPKKAANSCSKIIKGKLKNTKYTNKILINIISAPTIPEIPFLGRINVVKSQFWGWIATHIITRLANFLGTGLAKEVDIVDSLASNLPNYKIMGGSAVDDGKMLINYQFVNNQVHTNSIVVLGCCIDRPLLLNGTIGLHRTGKSFEITDTALNGYIITKINNKSAKTEFFNLLDFPEELIKELDLFYYKIVDYFPITFEENEERIIGIGGIFGDNLVASHRIDGKHAILLTNTGKEILDNIQQLLQQYNNTSPFLLSFSSAIYPFILRRRTFDIKTLLDQKLEKTPYMMVFPMVENIRIADETPSVRVYSTNMLSLL